MNKSISLTVDTDDYNALTRASDMLHGMAQDVKKDTGCKGCIDEDKDTSHIEKTIPAAEGGTKIDDKEVEIDIKREDYSVETSAATAFAADAESGDIVGNTETIAPEGVELDSKKLPWDVRIHSKNKSKLARDQSWKMKRGVDAALVVQVEAELRAAMATAPAQVETPATPAAIETPASPASPAAPAQVETPASPASPAAPAQVETAVLTFPDLMGKITMAMGANTLTQEMIMAVINPLGLASLPLVAARPDLIPEINTALFPNG